MQNTETPSSEAGVRAGGQGAMAFCLRMVDGPLAGKIWPISEQPLFLGRGIGCQVRIESPWVSRVHCEVRMENETPRLFHHSQHNPTFVNGAICPDAPLRPGDVIEFPGARLVLDLNEPGPGLSGMVKDPLDTTRTFEQSRCPLSKPDGSGSQPQNRICENQSLFLLLRGLGRADSLDALVKQLRTHLRDRLEADLCWIAWRVRFDGDMALFPAASAEKTSAAPHAILRDVCLRSLGLSAPERQRQGSYTIAAPLLHGGAAYGAIAVQRTAETALPFSDADLDYLVVTAEAAAPLIRAAERLEQVNQDRAIQEADLGGRPSMIGSGNAMQTLRAEIQTAAIARLNVLLIGETGVGKELAGRSIHDLSVRARGLYVAVNCAAIPGELFESEMFGHERGAFTGATHRRKGYFEQAHGGTLFLDEIGDLSLENQARLLRAAETNTFRRIGGENDIQVDVRILSATNRPMRDHHAAYFRQDLYHRLAGMCIQIPPLRERKDDIPELAQYFLSACSPHARAHPEAFSGQAMESILAYDWPGNIRELRNVVECAAYKATSRIVSETGLPGPGNLVEPALPSMPGPIDELERLYLTRVLEEHRGVVKEAAAALGMPKSTFYYKLAKHGIRTKG